MFAPDRLTVPVFVKSPTVSALPEITPLKLAVVFATAEITLVPAPKVMLLLIVLVAVSTSVPPLMVTPPVDRLDPLAPPEATLKVPALIVVPPV